MGYSYRLGDADRERLGCPEWLPLDVLNGTLDEVTELSDRFEFELEEWPEVLLGEVPFEFAGSPDAESKRKPPKWAGQAMLWMALHQNGVDLTWQEVGKLQILKVYAREELGPGKEEAAAPPADLDPEQIFGAPMTPPSFTSIPA